MTQTALGFGLIKKKKNTVMSFAKRARKQTEKQRMCIVGNVVYYTKMEKT